MAKILVIDDDDTVLHEVTQALKIDRHSVEAITDGTEGLQRLQTYYYDVAIIDWGLPGLSGVDICRRYRARGGEAMLLMLTGRTSVVDKETGLDSGADDYLPKPFSLAELLARVRALVRRAGQRPAEEIIQVKDVSIDVNAKRVTRNGEEITLSRKEFEILRLLAQHRDTPIGVEQLLKEVWSADEGGSTESVRTHLKTLRKKLGDAQIIETVHGMGYKIS